ncbi:uncharacterized protein N7446_006014 [Penicillium canescens]|uniref:S-adenosyl-L-methionine-dependent methyltransferase n=1 Tax=Penicillium canescens TaxID=5083 RepID=A0AAD6IIX0_PENCN|nr:uncharacterized protein N7446_006014 [Penicillium canescens]KAJ6051382.1 hypothetical protein N7460_001916 [Penicillium canescens]KAJ6061894.1 hypothetical protein N7446_006014 [Penicillium canescens]
MAEDMLAVDPDVYVTTTYGDDWQSETTSIGSAIYRGLMDNGRRYQTLSNKEYPVPSDEQSFESYEAGHLVDLILESDEENPLFKAPIRYKEAQILDIGTGQGNWAIDVADFLPQSTVHGVDLFPPPVTWVPPNCILEVDNILEEWTWNVPLDLIHMRGMTGSFEPHEWDRVYQQCYDNLKPGGWIEQLEASPYVLCDDDSLPADSILHTWGPNFTHCSIRAGRPIDTIDVMADTMRKAGFVDFHEKEYKWPIGPWPRDQKYKEAGTAHYQHWLSGMEGWCMWLLTKYGAPNPWSKDEVTVYVAKLRAEIKNPRYHIYQRARRVWARKPFPEELAREASVKEEEETLDINPLYIKQEPQE